MTNVATQTDLEWIAGVKCQCLLEPLGPKSCAYCGGITTPHSKQCENCQGTGYRFPWLWRECEWRQAPPYLLRGDVIVDHAFCNGCGDTFTGENPTGHVLIEGEGEQLLGLLKVFEIVGFDTLWYANPGLELVGIEGRWLAGKITGPDNDLVCVKRCDTKEQAERWLSPAGATPFDALASACRKALEG